MREPAWQEAEEKWQMTYVLLVLLPCFFIVFILLFLNFDMKCQIFLWCKLSYNNWDCFGDGRETRYESGYEPADLYKHRGYALNDAKKFIKKEQYQYFFHHISYLLIFNQADDIAFNSTFTHLCLNISVRTLKSFGTSKCRTGSTSFHHQWIVVFQL